MNRRPSISSSSSDLIFQRSVVLAKASRIFDLEAYASRYAKHSETRLQRLIFIAASAGDAVEKLSMRNDNECLTVDAIDAGCTEEDLLCLVRLCRTGYEMARNELMETHNVSRYRQLFCKAPAMMQSNSGAGDSASGEFQLQRKVESLAVASTAGNSGFGSMTSPETTTPVGDAVGESMGQQQNAMRHFKFHRIECDEEWMNRVQQENSIKMEVLESRLNTAKSRLNKESIRSSYLEFGDFYKSKGMLRESRMCHLRSREYCSTPKQNGQMCLSVIELGIDLQNFTEVKSYVNKAENTGNLISSESLMVAKLRSASGVASMYSNSFGEAGKKFIRVPIELSSEYNTVISPEDIALYGSILSLASLSRSELQKNIVDSAMFKQRLELLPWMRDAIRHFTRAEYGDFMSILEKKKGSMYMDLHLSPHVDNIFHKIRDKCMIQYVMPFLTVKLETMGKMFGMDYDGIEDAVAKLIDEKKISGRINSQDKILKANSEPNYRLESLRKAEELGSTYLSNLQSTLLRVSCLHAGIEVTGDSAISRRGRGCRRGRQPTFGIGQESFGESSEGEDMVIDPEEMNIDSRGD